MISSLLLPGRTLPWPKTRAPHLGSVVTGLLCDRYFGGRMVTATFPFAILAALAFFCWCHVPSCCCAAHVVADSSCCRRGLSCLLEGGTPLGASVHVAYVALTGFLVAGGHHNNNTRDATTTNDDNYPRAPRSAYTLLQQGRTACSAAPPHATCVNTPA